MTKINWQSLLRSLGVQVTTEGKNTKPGCLSIKCPLCGFGDPSEHLVLNPKTNRWFCWRNKDHYGRDPARLVQHIIRGSLEQANTILAQASEEDLGGSDLSLGELSDKLKNMGRTPTSKTDEAFQMPPEIKSLSGSVSPTAQRFRRYLSIDRTFGSRTSKACKRYELHYCVSGDWAHRIIIPFYVNGELKGWTGRSVLDKPKLRYDTFPFGDASKRLVFNSDNAAGGRALFIAEGPFDAMKIDLFGYRLGAHAVATLGVNTLQAQIAILHSLSRKYDRLIVAFDPKAESQALQLRSELVCCGKQVSIGRVPDGIEDPGAMTKSQAIKFITHYV